MAPNPDRRTPDETPVVTAFAELAELTRDILVREDVFAVGNRLEPGQDPFDPGRWRRLAEVGLSGLGAPEAPGGPPSFRSAAVLAEEVGRVLLPDPVAGTSLGGAVLAAGQAPAAQAALTAELAAGTTVCGWLAGTYVLTDGRLSGQAETVLVGRPDVFLGVTNEGTAVAVRSGDAKTDTVDDHDPSRPLAVVHLDGLQPLAAWPSPWPAETLEALRVTLYAAEAVGSMAAALDLTVAYAQEREQFGRPIGSFQALKHRCADLFTAVALARAALRRSATAHEAGSPTAGRDLAAAAVIVADTFPDVAAAAVHLQGGMGVAWDSGCHRFVRRSLVTRRLLGDPAAHRERLLDAMREDPWQ